MIRSSANLSEQSKTTVATNVIQLSVIIVTYKSKEVIDDCLKSIEKHNDIGEKLEVLVVDNSPIEDETFLYIQENYKWVNIFQNLENKGFGQGNNIGAHHARGQYLLFLNPDTILIQPIFSFALKQFEKDKSLGAFGLILVSPDGKYSNSYGIMPEKKSICPAKSYLPAIKYFNFTPQHIYPLGADLFIRKDLFFRGGQFDENIFLCYEEPDLIKRLAGHKVRIFNKKMIHSGGHTTDDDEKRMSEYIKSEIYYFRKHKLNYRKYAKRARLSLGLKIMMLNVMKKPVCFADKRMYEYYKKVLS